MKKVELLLESSDSRSNQELLVCIRDAIESRSKVDIVFGELYDTEDPRQTSYIRKGGESGTNSNR